MHAYIRLSMFGSQKRCIFGDVVFQQSLVEWAGTPIHGFRPLRWTSLINSLTWEANQQGCWSKWSNPFSLHGLQPNAMWQKWIWHKIIWGDICDRLVINIGGLAQWHLHSDGWSRRACPGSNEFIYGGAEWHFQCPPVTWVCHSWIRLNCMNRNHWILVLFLRPTLAIRS